MEWHRLGEYIEAYKQRCGDTQAAVAGVDINKQFIETRANLSETDVSNYYEVPSCGFACNLMHIGRDERLPIAYNQTEKSLVVTSAYFVFVIKKTAVGKILGEYLYLLLSRNEADRLSWFYTDSSVRGNLKSARFLEIEIPVPSIEEQRRVVEAWQGLRKMKEQNEQLAEPLLALCRSYLQECKKKYPMVEIGPMIEQRLEINKSGLYGERDARGVNTQKEIQLCKRMGENLDGYKIVHPRDIVFNANIKLTKETTKFAVALYEGDANVIVTNFYTVFSVKDRQLLPEFLLLNLAKDDFARYVKFMSCSSIRDRFDFADMEQVKIPLPPIEVQRAIVDVYRCANEAKKIAAEADRLSREICPALIQHVIKGAA